MKTLNAATNCTPFVKLGTKGVQHSLKQIYVVARATVQDCLLDSRMVMFLELIYFFGSDSLLVRFPA